MSARPPLGDITSNSSDLEMPDMEQIRRVIREELDLVATDMLNLIDKMFEDHFEDMKRLQKNLTNEADIQWKNHNKTIQKAMKKFFIQNFPGPIEVTPAPKGFLSDAADGDLETGSESQRFQKRWTRDLYIASFQPLNMSNQQREELKVLLDQKFRNFFQNFRSHITGDNPSTGVGKVQESLKKALEILCENTPTDPKRDIEDALEEHQDQLIAMFEVSKDVPSKTVRQNINRALLLGEGCSSGCKARADVLYSLVEDLCRYAENSSSLIESFVSVNVAAGSQSALQQSLNRFTGFNPHTRKRRLENSNHEDVQQQ